LAFLGHIDWKALSLPFGTNSKGEKHRIVNLDSRSNRT
jgi:hypothetical protein